MGQIFYFFISEPSKPIYKVTIQLAWWFLTRRFFKISANENTLWTLAAMLDFKSAPKTQLW
jgi:hypothetical protein